MQEQDNPWLRSPIVLSTETFSLFGILLNESRLEKLAQFLTRNGFYDRSVIV